MFNKYLSQIFQKLSEHRKSASKLGLGFNMFGGLLIKKTNNKYERVENFRLNDKLLKDLRKVFVKHKLIKKCVLPKEVVK